MFLEFRSKTGLPVLIRPDQVVRLDGLQSEGLTAVHTRDGRDVVVQGRLELVRDALMGTEGDRTRTAHKRLADAARTLIADVKSRHPGEALRCPLMIELDNALWEMGR